MQEASEPRGRPDRPGERPVRIVLRVLGATFVLFFALGFVRSSLRLDAPELVDRLFQWGELGNAEEQMISAIYVVWGVFMWLAAADPFRHRLFVDFTLIGNAVHFAVMSIQALAFEGEHLHLAGDVLIGWLLVATLAATWLPVRGRTGR